MNNSVYFYVEYAYYYPHFIPIAQVFANNGFKITFILSSKQNPKLLEHIAISNNFNYLIGKEHIWNNKADVIFFANIFENIQNVQTLTVFLEHGIGTKSTSFYSYIQYFDIYLVEGIYKYNRLKELYPQYEHKLRMVGYSKFDDILNFDDTQKRLLLKRYNLDPYKKTILYAPTFFPSSIEKMSNNFAKDLSNYNIIIKPHYLSFERKRYKNHIKKFDRWQQNPNCAIASLDEYNIIPYLATADIMISDESSAMFEFACLNKPVISNRFFKLRWSYYLLPWKLKKRIDNSKDLYRAMLISAYSYENMLSIIHNINFHINTIADIQRKYAHELCGEIGNSSQKIYNYIIKELG